MDCPHIRAYPKHALYGISLQESSRSTARSVDVATDAADMPPFVGSLFMNYSDIDGSWKAAPAQLLTRIVSDAFHLTSVGIPARLD